MSEKRMAAGNDPARGARFARQPRFHWTALALAGLVATSACGGADEADGEPPGVASDLPGAGAGGNADGTTPAATNGAFELDVSDGPFAGIHTATGDLQCFSQDGIWGATMPVDAETGVTEVYAMLQGVPDEGGSTEYVDFAATFGQVDDDSGEAGMVGIGGAAGGGAGVGRVDRDGAAAVVEVEGTTRYGARLHAIFRCGAVD